MTFGHHLVLVFSLFSFVIVVVILIYFFLAAILWQGRHFVLVCVFSAVYSVLVYRFFGTTGVDCVFTVVFCVRRPFCGDVSAILIFFSCVLVVLVFCYFCCSFI